LNVRELEEKAFIKKKQMVFFLFSTCFLNHFSTPQKQPAPNEIFCIFDCEVLLQGNSGLEKTKNKMRSKIK
jgi:hypothetical protein